MSWVIRAAINENPVGMEEFLAALRAKFPTLYIEEWNSGQIAIHSPIPTGVEDMAKSMGWVTTRTPAPDKPGYVKEFFPYGNENMCSVCNEYVAEIDDMGITMCQDCLNQRPAVKRSLKERGDWEDFESGRPMSEDD